MKNNKQAILSRRKFLESSLKIMGGIALASHPLGLSASGRMLTANNTLSGYKALVCLYLSGGNDSVNMVIPRSSAEYQQYAQLRQSLAIANDQILPIETSNSQQAKFGLHPIMTGLHNLYNQQKVSIVANVGSLVQPTSYAQFNNKSVQLPPHLFSHNDQTKQWLTAYPQQRNRLGWAGRMADQLAQAVTGNIPMSISAAGSNIWQTGENHLPYSLSKNGAVTYSGMGLKRQDDLLRRERYQRILKQQQSHLMVDEYRKLQQRSLDLSDYISQALSELPEITTVFPNTSLGQQLKVVAQMLQARDTFETNRQCFFVRKGGFDTHSDQNQRQGELLEDVDQCLAAFQAALEEIGVDDNVVTFTSSDFGRSVGTNGDGTDHGWGGHHIVMGSPVNGGNIIGRMPDLDLNNTDTVKKGRLLPQFSVDQYTATLASWYGLSAEQLQTVFPNLNNFQQQNLGFIL